MDTTRTIQIWIARADLFVVTALRYIGILALLTIVLAILVWAIRDTIEDKMYLIDYDKPYDITSEGPDDYTEEVIYYDRHIDG